LFFFIIAVLDVKGTISVKTDGSFFSWFMVDGSWFMVEHAIQAFFGYGLRTMNYEP